VTANLGEATTLALVTEISARVDLPVAVILDRLDLPDDVDLAYRTVDQG
jgi:hypothetical protein